MNNNEIYKEIVSQLIIDHNRSNIYTIITVEALDDAMKGNKFPTFIYFYFYASDFTYNTF